MLYFRLWLAYARHCAKCFVESRIAPSNVANAEVLGREVFSRSNFTVSTGRIKPGLFLPKEIDRKPLSVNRLSLARRKLFVALGQLHGSRRQNNFYGFAELSAEAVRQVRGDDGWQMDVRGTFLFGNPLHADLSISEEKGIDYDLLIADQLCMKAKFRGLQE